jgi:type II secretory pathway pseudopilin PulG
MKKKNINQKGFSLVELLIYMGVLAVLIGVMSTLLGNIFDVQLDSSSSSSVDQDSRFIQGRMMYDMQRASSITLPAAGAPGPMLQIIVNSVNYTYSLNGTNLQLNDGTTTSQLNSTDTSISGLSFQHLGSGTSNDTVRVNYTVTSKVQEHSGTESRAIQTTLGLP